MRNGYSRISCTEAAGTCRAASLYKASSYDRIDRQTADRKKLRIAVRRKREREVRRQMTILAAGIAIAIALIVFIVFGLRSNASSGQNTDFKYYTSVTLNTRDDFDSVVDRYCDLDHYKSREAYIRELCEINRFYSYPYELPDLRPGDSMIVTYYSEKFQ